MAPFWRFWTVVGFVGFFVGAWLQPRASAPAWIFGGLIGAFFMACAWSEEKARSGSDGT